MGAGRDITRHSALIRKEQQRRNREALIEAEKRRTAAEALAKMSPSEIRRQTTAARRQIRLQRSGHAIVGSEEKMIGPGSEFNKMLVPAEDVKFASHPAKKLAEESGIPASIIATFAPSSEHGYTIDDIRSIIATMEEEDDGENDEDIEDDDEVGE